MLCPRCRIHLNRAATKQGLVFCCPQCRGRAVALAVRRRVGSKRCVQQLWQQAWRHEGQHGAPCPVCNRAMAQLPLAANRPALQLDICTGCLVFWFLLQFVLVFEQHLGVGNVAAWAHLGGAAVGAVAWFLWRSDSLLGRKMV